MTLIYDKFLWFFNKQAFTIFSSLVTPVRFFHFSSESPEAIKSKICCNDRLSPKDKRFLVDSIIDQCWRWNNIDLLEEGVFNVESKARFKYLEVCILGVIYQKILSIDDWTTEDKGWKGGNYGLHPNSFQKSLWL